MSITYNLVCALLIGVVFGALITLATWPHPDERHFVHLGRSDAIRRGLVLGVFTTIWAAIVLTVMAVVLP